MNGLLSYLADLFGQSRYLAHSICLSNDPIIVPMFFVSDTSIGLSYYVIGGALYFCYQHKERIIRLALIILHDTQFIRLFFLFITCCGTTHITMAATLWWGIYLLDAFARFVTMIVSVLTALRVVAVIIKSHRSSIGLDKLSGATAPPYETRPLSLPNEAAERLATRAPPSSANH